MPTPSRLKASLVKASAINQLLREEAVRDVVGWNTRYEAEHMPRTALEHWTSARRLAGVDALVVAAGQRRRRRRKRY